jgi:hypothetical protein
MATYIWSEGHKTEDDSWLWSSCEKGHGDYLPVNFGSNCELLVISS